ncbi:MAG: DUF1874 domain-containing protein [Aquificae bacterium]|nr:DUF1874 domain-containing protein [Aquificota bacterium]
MLERLNNNRIAHYLQSLIRRSSHLREEDLKEVLEFFPFSVKEGEENPNFYAVKLFREVKEKVDKNTLSRKLSVDLQTVESLLSAQSFEVYFPVAKRGKAFLAKALVIPLGGETSLILEGVSQKTVKALENLTNKRFFLTFSRGFDFKTDSFMLAVFSALSFGKKAENFAFTGVLSEEGHIEEVQHVREKLETARKERVPLVFPSECMNRIEKLREFMENLTIPVAILPSGRGGLSTEIFEREFSFQKEYLEEVFHIDEGLFYTEPFENTLKSFENFAGWIEKLSHRLASLKGKVDFKVALTSKVLMMSFLAGVRFSKARLKVDFYELRNREGYSKVLSLEDDLPCGGEKRLIESFKPGGEVKEVFISTSERPIKEGRLLVRIPSGEKLNRNLLETACQVNDLLRGENFGCVHLKIEAPNSFAFALGYMLEDYKCFILNHFSAGEYVPVYRIGGEGRGKIYLLNAFSINMLEKMPAHVEFDEVSLDEVLQLIREEGFRSYISHLSTAQVLSELLKEQVEQNRVNIKLPHGAKAVVFQLKVRPPEGGVFGVEDLKDIIERGLFSFYKVRVFY